MPYQHRSALEPDGLDRGAKALLDYLGISPKHRGRDGMEGGGE